eukprot:CAMPEP_0201569600 /NCGR_PEP_ID=MMETSP0190_2-20130828/11379_1 /ASSEMBLY_ACC=CAM_ASM_000263 /TAXON_ID=37353 /ORGANISM="Rosalina sp." /LENGTH=46 /DNA_ID= /DNA_START= /DNA_END= /DNA_ORIENTATION=
MMDHNWYWDMNKVKHYYLQWDIHLKKNFVNENWSCMVSSADPLNDD